MLRRAGVAAYLITADELGSELVGLAEGTARDVGGGDFLALFDEHEWASAVAELGAVLGQSGRVLSEAAACVLCDSIRRAGVALGRLEVPPESEGPFAAWSERFFPRLIGLPDAHVRALSAGFMELRGVNRFEFGALPLEALRRTDWSAREWSPGERATMGETSPLDDAWSEGLLEILRAAQRLAPATTDTAAVVFVPWWVRSAEREPAREEARRPDAGPGWPSILDLLQRAVAANASDLVLTVGRPPHLRVRGRLRALDGPPLDDDGVRRLVHVLLTEGQRERLDRDEALRVSFGVRGVGRFRATLFFQRGCLAASLRVHPAEVPALDALGLPAEAIARLERARSGLVLVAGPAGSGRTTTAAAVVTRHARAGRSVLTIEEPIEHVLAHGDGLVNQVEPSPLGMSFAAAAALARDAEADVALVDHVDDPARAALALDLAAQGRLVVSTTAAADPDDARARLSLRLGDGPAARDVVARHVALVLWQRPREQAGLEVRLG